MTGRSSHLTCYGARSDMTVGRLISLHPEMIFGGKMKQSWKRWIIGGLVAMGVASSYAAGWVGGRKVPPSKWGMTCAGAQAILDQKRACGFLDLGKLVTVYGCVLRTHVHNDGDFSINLKPDDPTVLFYQGRLTRDYLHAEFMPCERGFADVEQTLQTIAKEAGDGCAMRVRITGRLAYDGVDHRGEWDGQVAACLDGREPDPSVGWMEIHPAYAVEILRD